MFDYIEQLPIRPAFGTMRGVMEGVVLNSKRVGTGEWITAQPPASLAHLHRPARISAIWERVMDLLRNPVEVHHLSGNLDIFNILGSAVIARSESGLLTPYLWCQKSLDQPYIDEADPATVVLRNMPWRWIWLDRVLGFAMQEYSAELEFLHISASMEELSAYFKWANQVFRKRISRHADMAQVRRRIANALELDPETLRLASYGVPRGQLWSMTTVQDYTLAWLLRGELLQLEQDAPNLLPLYITLCNLMEHPEEGERVQHLKACLLANGFKESHWRFISKCNRRLLLPMRYVYRGQDVAEETLDYLRIVCDLGFQQQLPEPLLITLFSVWGNPAQRSHSYAAEYAVHRCYPHIMKLAAERFGRVDFDELEDELLAIIRWSWDVKLSLTKDQRREGWPWLLKQARAHLAMLDAKERGQTVKWKVPTQVHTVGPFQLRFLESSYDLWDESQAMRHCVDRYVQRCQESNARIASVTCGQRRVATAMFIWSDDQLKLVQIAGKANRPVSMVMTKSLGKLQIKCADEQVKAIPLEAPIICRREHMPAEEIEAISDSNAQAESPIPVQKEVTTMTALLTNTGSFIREVNIKPVQAIADTFQVEFKSRLLTARNPLAYQKNFSLILDRSALLELKAIIERSLA